MDCNSLLTSVQRVFPSGRALSLAETAFLLWLWKMGLKAQFRGASLCGLSGIS